LLARQQRDEIGHAEGKEKQLVRGRERERGKGRKKKETKREREKKATILPRGRELRARRGVVRWKTRVNA
jgi:hypothetical protein